MKANDKARHWIILLNTEFWFTVHLQYLVISNDTWKHPIGIYLKYIIITIIISIITRSRRIIPNKNTPNGWRFVSWVHHIHRAIVRLKQRHASVRAWGFPTFRRRDVAGVVPKWPPLTVFLQPLWVLAPWFRDFLDFAVYFFQKYSLKTYSDMDECCARRCSFLGWDPCRKWETRKNKMWLAALNADFPTKQMTWFSLLTFIFWGPRGGSKPGDPVMSLSTHSGSHSELDPHAIGDASAISHSLMFENNILSHGKSQCSVKQTSQ